MSAFFTSVWLYETHSFNFTLALPLALIPLLFPCVIDPDSGAESQAKILRYVKAPDYFSEFKERGGDWGCYLGGCIMAKVSLTAHDCDLVLKDRFVARSVFLIFSLSSLWLVVYGEFRGSVFADTALSQSKSEYSTRGPAAYRLLEAL